MLDQSSEQDQHVHRTDPEGEVGSVVVDASDLKIRGVGSFPLQLPSLAVI